MIRLLVAFDMGVIPLLLLQLLIPMDRVPCLAFCALIQRFVVSCFCSLTARALIDSYNYGFGLPTSSKFNFLSISLF